MGIGCWLKWAGHDLTATHVPKQPADGRINSVFGLLIAALIYTSEKARSFSWTFGNQALELCQAMCICGMAGKMCLASGQTGLERRRQEASACKYCACSSLGMWETSDSFMKLLLPLVASSAFTIACGWSFPICIADEDFGQAVITGGLNWAEKYLILGTKTLQDHSEGRHIFQFGSEEFICRWE